MHKIYICANQRAGGAGCIKGSKAVLDALTVQANQREGVEVIKTTCMGYCAKGPNVKIHGGALFHRVQVDEVEEVLDALDVR